MRATIRAATAAAIVLSVVGCGLTPGQAVPDPQLAEVANAAVGSVARVLGTRCGSNPLFGSAFVVGSSELLTASHVVGGARHVAVALPGAGVALAEVVGLDPRTDTALLRTADALSAAPLDLADEPPSVGSAAASIGYPLGSDGPAIGQGPVTSTTDDVVVNGYDASRLVTVDLQLAIGSSGGPVLDRDGAVVGMVAATMAGRLWRDRSAQVTLAIPAGLLSERLDGWARASTPLGAPCPGEAGGSQPPPELIDAAGAGDAGITIWLLGAGLNAGAYQSSWQLLTPAARLAAGSFENWRTDVVGITWQTLQLTSAHRSGDLAQVSATVAAVGPDGCATSELDYRLRRVNGLWLIDQSTQRALGEC
jgi:Trypsin-like serine proteases, typically periplasmic, contain C-terminal PDZ domain